MNWAVSDACALGSLLRREQIIFSPSERAVEQSEVEVSMSRSLAIDYEFFQIWENLEGKVAKRSVDHR